MNRMLKMKKTRDLQPSAHLHLGGIAIGSAAIGSLAIAACALGAVAVGALAIGRVVVRRMSVAKGEFKCLHVGDLRVDRLQVGALVVKESLKIPPSR